MNNDQAIIAEQQSIIKQTASTTTPRLFFSLLHKFSRTVLTNPIFVIAIKILMDKERAASYPVKQAEDEALEELLLKHKRMQKYVDDNKINNKTIIQALNTFEEKIKASKSLSRHTFSFIEQALYHLTNDDTSDHSNFLKTFGKVNIIGDDRYIHTSEAFPKFDRWEKEVLYFTQKREMSDWYSLNQIMAFIERYDFELYEKLTSELIAKNIDISQLEREHTSLIDFAYFNKQPSSNQFPTIEEYKLHMTRLLDALIYINSAEVTNDISKEPITIDAHYNRDKDGEICILDINGIKMPDFERKSIEDKFIDALSLQGKPFKGVMTVRKIGQIVFQTNHLTKEQKDSLYKAKKRVNTKVKKYTKIADLFISDGRGRMGWNPKYNYV